LGMSFCHWSKSPFDNFPFHINLPERLPRKMVCFWTVLFNLKALVENSRNQLVKAAGISTFDIRYLDLKRFS